MRVYLGAHYRLAKSLSVGAAIPVNLVPPKLEAFKHFMAVLFWLWVIGTVLAMLGFK